jgi:hypothetical protein
MQLIRTSQWWKSEEIEDRHNSAHAAFIEPHNFLLPRRTRAQPLVAAYHGLLRRMNSSTVASRRLFSVGARGGPFKYYIIL